MTALLLGVGDLGTRCLESDQGQDFNTSLGDNISNRLPWAEILKPSMLLYLYCLEEHVFHAP